MFKNWEDLRRVFEYFFRNLRDKEPIRLTISPAGHLTCQMITLRLKIMTKRTITPIPINNSNHVSVSHIVSLGLTDRLKLRGRTTVNSIKTRQLLMNVGVLLVYNRLKL